jgi:hypothetical protein
MRELFVYYRVRPADARAAHAAVLAFHAALMQRHPTLKARLLRRPESGQAEQTWMETYATDAPADSAGISASMQADIETSAQALAPFVQGTRHVEVFEAFIACAS